MNITDEKFVEVLKSLTQEDFDAVQNTVEQLTAKFDKNQITHIGEYESGSKVYMRKNKCGQWNVLVSGRKGYRWDAINYLNYPNTIYGISKEQLEDHLFESTRVLK